MTLLRRLAATALWWTCFVPLNAVIVGAAVMQVSSCKRGPKTEQRLCSTDDDDIGHFLEANIGRIKSRDMDEGLGTAYERRMVDKLLIRLSEQGTIEPPFVLEAPGDGVTGVPGINGRTLYEKRGFRTFLCCPSLTFLAESRRQWRRLGLPEAASFAQASAMAHLPLGDSSVGMAWNFCMIEKLGNPEVFISELARISGGPVCVIVINRSNPGYRLHRWFHRCLGQEWDHGHDAVMSLEGLLGIAEKAGLAVRESGGIDAPPSMDTQDMPLGYEVKRTFGISGGRGGRGGRAERNSVLGVFEWIEDNLPQGFKTAMAHHLYIVGMASEKSKDA